ncbi:hypothetical protein MLD38_029014 [Melastoma candidum]|uniref:Uncharacterized protein n=1 Tax=Melastoma candidum TaxID=119954 RepID=A0ACB9N507_9MYRT|nr:hypothetical protein MLD38_029014 [Melastoma candidum]
MLAHRHQEGVASSSIGSQGKTSKRVHFVRNLIREVAGFAPYEKRITELLKVGKDKLALKLAVDWIFIQQFRLGSLVFTYDPSDNQTSAERSSSLVLGTLPSHSAASSHLIQDKRITGTRFDGTWIHLELQNYVQGFSQLISDRSMISEYSEDHESLMEDTPDGGGVACPQLGLQGLRSKLKGVEEVRRRHGDPEAHMKGYRLEEKKVLKAVRRAGKAPELWPFPRQSHFTSFC